MIYFDNAASTSVNHEVLALYMKVLQDYYANQGSSHELGLRVNELVSKSKKSILESLGLGSEYQVIFTSGATEANNLFLKGAAENYRLRGKKIVTSRGEHASVIKPLIKLKEDYGFEVVELPLTEAGVIDPDDLKKAIDDDTIIVSIMAVNNETGAINDLKAIKEILSDYPKCLFHSDVTQALAKVVVDYTLLDAMSFSAHKINGLKGSGALVLKKSIVLNPLFDGGNYEYGFRAGTPDSPKNIVLAKTLKLALKNYKSHLAMIQSLNDQLYQHLLSNALVEINTPKFHSPFILNFSLRKHKAAIIANGLSKKGIMVGTTSACSAKSHQPSHVIKAMFTDEHRASEVIRISFGTNNNKEDVEVLIKQLTHLLEDTKYD